MPRDAALSVCPSSMSGYSSNAGLTLGVLFVGLRSRGVISTIYVEEDVLAHPRARMIRNRFSAASEIICRRYGEVFNPKAQNFRLQKRRPALILAHKFDGHVLETPRGYGIGGEKNYYFSHMLNCLYDCRYCFLQGMYRSAHYVLFVNYEDFGHAIDERRDKAPGAQTWFFSGYDCDSLAMEPITDFVKYFVPFFACRPDAHLELRTKSTQVRALLAADPVPNVVTAFSFTPEGISRKVEHKVPAVSRRIAALVRLQSVGWRVGLRFDPLIYQQNFESAYSQLFEQVFSAVDLHSLHSVSLGPFRLPREYHKNLARMYPDEAFLAGPLEDVEGMVSYPGPLERELVAFCSQELAKYVPTTMIFPCTIEV